MIGTAAPLGAPVPLLPISPTGRAGTGFIEADHTLKFATSEGGEVMPEEKGPKTFDRAVNLGNLLVALVPLCLALVLMLTQNASDKAMMAERVEQYHKAEDLAVNANKEDIKAQSDRTDSILATMTANHLEVMTALGGSKQQIEDLYRILKDNPNTPSH